MHAFITRFGQICVFVYFLHADLAGFHTAGGGGGGGGVPWDFHPQKAMMFQHNSKAHAEIHVCMGLL